MAHNYTIQFKSLRSATVYTLAIGGGTGDAIPLTPGAQPFTTQEDDNEDVFTPVRTQSGYLRVVDDGKDANGNLWDWKDLIPATDTSRPVILTHMIPNPDAGQEGEPDEIEVTDWVGFMQAQTFSGVLYGNPQEREFPVQCPLAVTEGTDINYTQTEVKNFAYLLKQVVDSIPSGARPTSFVIQGGADAQGWLLKQIDWMNFVSIDADENLSARYSMFQCMEDMCRFWGWTVRVHRQTLYMTCADDTDENTFLTLTTEQLATIAGGTAAGTTNTAYTETTLPTDAFCNVDNYEFVVRGYNEAVVQADANGGDEHMLQYADSEMVKEMERQTWSQPVTDGEKLVSYTLDILSFTRPLVTLTATENYGSFNIAKIQDSARDEGENINVMRIKKSYANAAPASIAVQTKYEHCFSNGYLVIRGSTYRLATLFEDVSESDRSLGITTGGKRMYCMLGIGKTRQTCKWWNGGSWQTESCKCKLTLGNTDDIFSTVSLSGNFMSRRITAPNAVGRIFFDIYGSDDMPERDDQRSFEIANLEIDYYVNGTFTNHTLTTRGNLAEIREYKSKNQNAVKDEFNADCIFASLNGMIFGYGLLINPDGSFMESATYGEQSKNPEQYLADRVTSYWDTSRRKLTVDLLSSAVADVTPSHMTTMDGYRCHPIAISHQWRDDITEIVMMEMPPLPEPEPEE